MGIEKVLDNIKKGQVNKLKKEIFLMVLIFMPLIYSEANPQTSIQVMIIMFIPTLLVVPRIIYHIYIYYKPEKAACFKRVEELVPREKACDYIANQLDNKIVEDGVLIITPDLLIDVNNYENIFIRKYIKELVFIKDFYEGKYFYKITFTYKDKKTYTVSYEGYPNTEAEVEEMLHLIRKRSW